MRYIARRIRPDGSTPVGSSNTLIRHYADDRNALRFMHKHLRSAAFAPGQYKLERWPEGTFTDGKHVGFLYKTV